ncbi:hypothetical protein SUNI508_03804 [Seiridium unicorne]|uniref:Uncharacterized protein n=1 Tax=Seiridium unicorne TaxID=138068 RepID=A0ABR2VA53_9PEZI
MSKKGKQHLWSR